jgi:hypothetical protein
MVAASDLVPHLARITGLPLSTVIGVKRRFVETVTEASLRLSTVRVSHFTTHALTAEKRLQRRDQRHGTERWLMERPPQPRKLMTVAALAIILWKPKLIQNVWSS